VPSRLGDRSLTSETLGFMGTSELRHGKLESAEARFREILAIARELKGPYTTILGLKLRQAGSRYARS